MKLYYFIYYKLYQLMEDWGFWPEARAFSLLIMLNIVFLGSLLNYFTIFTGIFISLPENKIWLYVLVIFVVLVNYLLLLRGNKRQVIIKMFDKISTKKDIIGTVSVFLGIILLVIAYISSFSTLNSIR